MDQDKARTLFEAIATPEGFRRFMSIMKKFPYIRKLEADECGSFERPEILEIVRTCSSLQYFSSVANGKRSTLAISDHNLMMRESASEQISKSFGRLGGELILEKYGVTLTVPEGAIEREGEIDIGLQVLTNPPSTHLQEDEMVCSFGFRCTIPKLPGLRFAKPVKVTVPHSAILEVHPSEVHVGMYSGELWHDTGDVEISTISYNWPSKGSLPRCEQGTNEISVFIDHFSFGWPVLKIRNPFDRKKHVRGKRMGCLSFVPIQMPPTRKPVLRVQLFDYLNGNHEAISKEESECDFRKAHPKFELCVKSNLDVTYRMDGSTPEDRSMNTRAILYKDLKKKISESVTFALDFSEREKLYALVNLSLTQPDPEHAEERQDHDFNVDFRGDSRESSSSVTRLVMISAS
ncbi:uncharacterized protein LOC129276002 isoform X2 [Lytechinus pictus]|uniref:uncharacterized protein LOC129276002 isoform X2 n=1 Tax=Lytechinus pictus TaxID=7653 RepID=UPI0030B9F188